MKENEGATYPPAVRAWVAAAGILAGLAGLALGDRERVYVLAYGLAGAGLVFFFGLVLLAFLGVGAGEWPLLKILLLSGVFLTVALGWNHPARPPGKPWWH